MKANVLHKVQYGSLRGAEAPAMDTSGRETDKLLPAEMHSIIPCDPLT